MSLSNEILERKFKEFQESKEGAIKEKLKALGFVYDGEKTSIATIEEFKTVVESSDYMDDEKLTKFYGSFLTYKDVLQILKVGENGMTDNEIAEALKIIPCTPNLQISVKDFVKIIYQ